MKMEKLERIREQADERLQILQWFSEARAGFWRNKNGFIGGVGDAGNGMQARVQKSDAERAARKWKAKVHARIQGLGHAMGIITQASQAAQAWEEGMAVERKRQEAIYLIEQEQERNTVQARGWEWNSFRDEDEDEEWCEEWDGKCYWVDGERSTEVKTKIRNMVVKKNSKKKADVAKEENGERLIK